jgi:hypothetical protein
MMKQDSASAPLCFVLDTRTAQAPPLCFVLDTRTAGHQDSASAPTPHPHSPCPYRMEIWHQIVNGTPYVQIKVY